MGVCAWPCAYMHTCMHAYTYTHGHKRIHTSIRMYTSGMSANVSERVYGQNQSVGEALCTIGELAVAMTSTLNDCPGQDGKAPQGGGGDASELAGLVDKLRRATQSGHSREENVRLMSAPALDALQRMRESMDQDRQTAVGVCRLVWMCLCGWGEWLCVRVCVCTCACVRACVRVCMWVLVARAIAVGMHANSCRCLCRRKRSKCVQSCKPNTTPSLSRSVQCRDEVGKKTRRMHTQNVTSSCL